MKILKFDPESAKSGYRNLGEGAYLGKLCSIRDADAAERKMNYTPRPQVFYEPWDDYSHGFFV